MTTRRVGGMRVQWCLAALSAATCAFSGQASAQEGVFSDQLVAGGWNQAIGVRHLPDGRAFVWEKAGKVWMLDNHGISNTPVIDISEEVGNWRDYGLLAFAPDPNYSTNGYIYLAYVVDYHHLDKFGTAQYDPDANEYFHDTIARLTRYTVTNPNAQNPTVNYASRQILIGESKSTGMAITHETHGPGTILFGDDGTLLLTIGDGASFIGADIGGFRDGSSNTAETDGILAPHERIGAMRAQLLDTHSGKVLRVDPATGDGVPSNPFYNPAAPRSPRSRVWTLGLRQPFRASIRRGSGSVNPADGNPGTLFIGDVGWALWEELSIVPTGGLNLGWPLFEGLEPDGTYPNAGLVNQMAPNPLAGGACPPYLGFQHLLVEATQNTPSWPNPCDENVQIAANTPRFVHHRPVLDWGHGHTTRVGVFDEDGNAQRIPIDDPASPITGAPVPVSSSAAVGGVWYDATNYPEEYHNTYFFADFTGGWIRNLSFDGAGNPSELRVLAVNRGAIVCVDLNPVDGALYYIRYNELGQSELRRIVWVLNDAPVAVITATPNYGPQPLEVSFSSTGSVDPEGGALTYRWDFGDGSIWNTNPSATHTYIAMNEVTMDGTIIARIDELDPPVPLGTGSQDREIIRDGHYPDPEIGEATEQWDHDHDGAQGNFDWIGYEYSETKIFRRIRYQEGIQNSFYGGWWNSFGVQVRVNGVWTNVTNFTITPAYGYDNNTNFDLYELNFDPMEGDAIRIAGEPGGVEGFLSVAELRVFVLPPGGPLSIASFDASLTVTDPLGVSSTSSVVISVNNTPPVVTMLSPVEGQTFPVNQNFVLPLLSEASDAEFASEDLVCTWNVILHHDDHTHPEPPDTNCQTSTLLTPHGGDPHIFFEVFLTVTDPAGLSTTVSRLVMPQGGPVCDSIDFNNDELFPDASDIDDLLSVFGGGPCSTGNCNDIDFNNDDFFPDATDIDSFLSVFSGGPCF